MSYKIMYQKSDGTIVEVSATNPLPMSVLPQSTASFSPTNIDSVAYEASHIVKAAPGTVYSVSGYNSGGAQFIQIHNTTTLPADTAVPLMVITAPATGNFAFSIPASGKFCSTGIVVCNSSTGPTKTIGSANCWFNVSFL